MNLIDLTRLAWRHDRGGALAVILAGALMLAASLLLESLQ